eukprot:SAG11_NODE_1618_length_4571_cov_11.714733_4_plen_131_part_00
MHGHGGLHEARGSSNVHLLVCVVRSVHACSTSCPAPRGRSEARARAAACGSAVRSSRPFLRVSHPQAQPRCSGAALRDRAKVNNAAYYAEERRAAGRRAYYGGWVANESGSPQRAKWIRNLREFGFDLDV